MAPITHRRVVARDRFSTLFSALKTQQYVDPPVRSAAPPVHRTIAWNASGSQIATGSNDKTIRVWNPERNQPKSQMKLEGHTSYVEKVLFNPIQEFELASASRDGTVKFWDTRNRACTHTLQMGEDVLTLSWSVDGTVLMAGTKSDILISISTTTTPPTILTKHPQKIRTNQTTFSNAHSPPTDLLITQGEGVQILSYPDLHPLHSLAAHTSSCTAIAYSPAGNYLAVGGSDAIVSLWSTTTWVCARTVSNPNTGKVAGLTWSWDGRYLFGASEEISGGAAGGGGGGGDGAKSAAGYDIYHAETGEVVHTIVTAGRNAIAAAEWHPSRYWLAYTLVEEKTGRSSLHIVGAGGGPSI